MFNNSKIPYQKLVNEGDRQDQKYSSQPLTNWFSRKGYDKIKDDEKKDNCNNNNNNSKRK